MKLQSVIFDLDGTLLNTLGDLADACNRALEQLGFPVHPEDDYRFFVGDGAKKLCERILPPDRQDAGTFAQARTLFDEAYHTNMFDRTAPYPGISELLAALRLRGFRLGVVSNKPDEFVQTIVLRYFPGCFDAVAGQQGALVKPDPSGVNALLHQLGICPAEALYVGDSAVDVKTAANAHTFCCGAAWGFRGETELRGAGARWIAQSPAGVLAVIEEEFQ